jgi:hypothetical protein
VDRRLQQQASSPPGRKPAKNPSQEPLYSLRVPLSQVPQGDIYWSRPTADTQSSIKQSITAVKWLEPQRTSPSQPGPKHAAITACCPKAAFKQNISRHATGMHPLPASTSSFPILLILAQGDNSITVRCSAVPWYTAGHQQADPAVRSYCLLGMRGSGGAMGAGARYCVGAGMLGIW